MKTTLCFTLMLFAFVMLAFVPNSFTEEMERPIVKVIYFIPKDVQPQPDIEEELISQVKKAQKLFGDLMEAHGFERKTFKIEEDTNDDVIVHHRRGTQSDAHYRRNIFSLWYEFPEESDLNKDFYIVFYETDTQRTDLPPLCGLGFNATEYKGGLLPSSGECFEGVFGVNVIAHELAHGFELAHDIRTDVDAQRIYLDSIDTMITTYCAAEWFDVHPAFNTGTRLLNRNTTARMLEPELASPPHNIRLRFEISDPDGIHMVKLLSPTDDGDLKLRDCRVLNGVSDITVEFVTNELPFYTDTIVLRMRDVIGSYKQQRFKLSEPLPFAPPKDVHIADPHLAAAIRRQIGESITTHTMLNLTTKIEAGRQGIRDLTGLEHAHNLRELRLRSNAISDVSPLAELKRLTFLALDDNAISDVSSLAHITNLQRLHLNFNQIEDITPLAQLTQLIRLNVSYNKIIDITPLSSLTQLNHLGLTKNSISDISPLTKLVQLSTLYLEDNQISDVSPLSELVNLKELRLRGNPIKNKKPLLELLKKNPDVKIYLENNLVPLPVNLSNFRAERTNAGVVLKWTTESEVDNAGFYIYRSKTRDGEFKVVNPTMIQGAGTTGERNEYTWTDTSAKPNTVYYYQIEDVSHAGVRELLSTVRIRGLVSARGKLTTIWADLKAEK